MSEPTYSDYLPLRKGSAPPPDTHASGVRVYADSDGALRSVQSDGTDAAIGGGGSTPFVNVVLRHSADFANMTGNAPVLVPAAAPIRGALTLPPSAFGDSSIIDVLVYNDTDVAVLIGGVLIVQNAAGTAWIEQDTGADQTIAAGANASIDFDTNGGSAGAGLSWDGTAKQVDIASAGVYSAFTSIVAAPA